MIGFALGPRSSSETHQAVINATENASLGQIIMDAGMLPPGNFVVRNFAQIQTIYILFS